MKRMWISFVALAAAGVLAKEQQTQSGTPALLEADNGNKARVFLQGLKDDNLTFQGYKSTKYMTVPLSKIKSLTFYPIYDAEAVEQQFNSGDYSAALSTLVPLMETFEDYMVVENNMRDTFCMLMEAYRKTGNLPKLREAANLLLNTGDPEMVLRGQVNIALAAITDGDLQTAKKIRDEVSSKAAELYLRACIERAENRPKDAIKTISNLIIDYANDVEWLGPSELLCVYLYMDMLGPDSVITTNSALHTARQVKNIYTGSSVSADAEKIWVSLGGAEIEALEAAKKAEQEKILEESKAKRKAEAQARKEANAALQIENEAGTNVNASTEMEAGTNVNTGTEMESK
jgi:hypothetical protein